MTQHPFDREFSEQEAAKLNTEQEQIQAEQELTDNDLEEVAGGLRPIITKGIDEGGITKATWETGGTSNPFLEAGTTKALSEAGGGATD
jgi:hypothetical protein